MIDGWVLLHNTLRVIGLAIVLGGTSLASYQASIAGMPFRDMIMRPGFRQASFGGLALASLGWMLGAGPWWARVAWGVLGALFAFGAGRAWLRSRTPGTSWLGYRGRREESTVPRRTRQIGWGLLLAGLLVLLAWGMVTGVDVLRHARSLQVHLRNLEILAEGDGGSVAGMLETVGTHLAGMHEDLEGIQDRVGPLLPLGRILRYVPRHGGDLAAASDLVDLAVGAASAGDRVYRALAPVLEGEGAVELSPGERLLPVVVAARPELLAAHEELAAAGLARARIDASRLSPRLAGLVGQLDGALPWLETAVDGLLLAPDLLGVEDRRVYLILAQNNHELRPTGGFISGVGELTVEGGRVSSLTFRDSYAVDNWRVPHDLPPPDMQATLAGDLWLFRDANWEADFPASARRALEIYARDQGVDAEGIIALDLTALVTLVEALGPLEVEGIAGPVTGQNVVETIQASWESPPDSPTLQETEWFQHRKDSFGAIAAAAVDKVLAGQELEPVPLALALKQMLEEKHILAYLEEPGATGLLGRMGWDGALPDPSGSSDFLMVADSNVGFNKVDANVERSIAYQVDLSAGSQPRVRLTLSYRNQSQQPLLFCIQEARYGETYTDMADRCYWDYVRVYVPSGSKLLKGPDLAPPPGSLLFRRGGGSGGALTKQVSEGAWTAWTGFFDLAPGEERTLTFEYRLPPSALARTREQVTYSLEVYKQPGTEAVPFCLEILPPADRELAEWVPAELLLPGPACTDLRTDRRFEAVYRQPRNP